MARSFCLLILLVSELFCNEDFWFSYKITTGNNIITSQQSNISPVMVYKQTAEKSFLCQLKAKKNQSQSTYEFLQKNSSELIDCFYHTNVKILSFSQSELRGIKASDELIIIPIKFTVDFNKQFANIYLLR